MVAFAFTVQFAPDEGSWFPRVESRMLLAGQSGRGSIEVDGVAVRISPGTVALLPWGHRVRYHPDVRDPFLVYGAHLIPWHAADVPVDLAVPHHPDHPLAGCPWRADRELRTGPGLWLSDQTHHPLLHSLVRTAAEVWDRGTPPLDVARALGVLIMSEIRSTDSAPRHDDHELPLRLRRVLAWVNAEPGRELSLDRMAVVADVSPATLTRLFRRHLGTSPLAWVLCVRIEVAKTLLTTTSLPVGLVARRAGFADSYYFSRRFRSHTGTTPTSWRRRWSAP